MPSPSQGVEEKRYANDYKGAWRPQTLHRVEDPSMIVNIEDQSDFQVLAQKSKNSVDFSAMVADFDTMFDGDRQT